MQWVRFAIVFTLGISFHLQAQQIASQPSGAVPVTAKPGILNLGAPTFLAAPHPEKSIVHLWYHNTTLPSFAWTMPNNYGSFINLFLMQRFTLPNNSAFLDSVTVYIADISDGPINLRVLGDTVINTGSGEFHFPVFANQIDLVTVDKTQLVMGAFNTIPFHGLRVPKEFFVSVEPTFTPSGNNAVRVISDNHSLPRRGTDKSRTVMVNQDGSNVNFLIMDSVFTNSGEYIYPYLYMFAHTDTATSVISPKFISAPVTTAYTDQPYFYHIQAVGIPRPGYSLVQGPFELTVDFYTGNVTWTPKVADIGSHNVTIRALNSNGEADQSFSINVVQSTTAKITSNPKTKALVGEPYFYTVTATGGPPPTFQLASGPQGMTLNTITGLIQITPQAGQVGTYTITVRAINGVGTDTQTYQLTIDATASAPNITSSPITDIDAGDEWLYQVIAAGNPSPTFSLAQSPGGMLIDQNTGVIRWQTSSANIGTHEIAVRAENRVAADTQRITLVVNPAALAPEITSSPTLKTIAGQQYAYLAQANGKPTPTFRLTQTPTGMSIDTVTGAIEWYPTRDQKGTNAVTVQAVNSIGTDDQTFTIYVMTTPRITSTAVTTGKAGLLYQYQVVTDAEPAPVYALVWSPTGMTIDTTTGLISWTPTLAQVGDNAVTLTATNEADGTNQSFTVKVSDPASVDDAPNAALARFESVFPQPASAGSERIAAQFTLSQAGFMRLELRSLLGETVAVLEDGFLPAGSRQTLINPRGLQLAPGMYFLALRHNGTVTTRPFIVIK